ncbi:MAG: hypothetical protein WKF43_05180 [Acidimicrobiales bacterium]
MTFRLLLASVAAEGPRSEPVTATRLLWAVLVTMFAFIPLGVSVWALLDAVRRPQWAWALSRHRQVPWLVAILFGLFTVIGGLLISGWYLARIRPAVAAVERGEIEA